MYIRKLPWFLLLAASTAVGLPPVTPEEAARAAQRAHLAQNAAEFRSLAAQDVPDPWLVAAALCAAEQFDTADAFALAAARLDTAKLPAALKGTRAAPPHRDDRARLEAALRAIESGDRETAAAVLEAIDSDGKSLFGVWVLAARGIASDAPDAYRATAAAARDLGWLRLAAESEQLAALRYERNGQLVEATASARARLQVETLRGGSAQLADALVEAGRLSLIVSELPESEDLLRRALRQAERQESRELTAKAERYLGLICQARGATHDGRIYLLRAVEHYQALGDTEAVLVALEPVIALDAGLDGIPRAMERAEEALAIARSIKAVATEGRVMATMGKLESERKAWADAVSRYDGAEALLRSVAAINAAGDAAYESGVLSLRMGRRDDARVSLTRAAADAQTTNDPALQARVQSALGDLSLELGQIDAAAGHLELAAKLAEATQNAALAARALSRLGRLALSRGKPKEARERLEAALQQLRTIRDTDEEVRTLLALGDAERMLGKLDRAAELADEATAIARRDQLPGILAQAAALRAQAAIGKGTTPAQAAAAFESLRATAREALALVESSRLATTPRFESDFDRLLRVGVDAALLADDLSLLLTVCEFRREREMVESLGGRRALIRALTSVKLRHRIDEVEKAEDAATAEYERARARLDKAAMFAARDKVQTARAARAEADKLVDAELAPARSLLAPGITTADAIQAVLAPSETLLYFCVGVEELGVVIVTRGGTRTLSLGSHHVLAAAAEELANALGPKDADADAAINRIRELLFVPLAIAEATQDLVIVPVAPLDRLPFCLLDANITVRYADSAASLVAAARMAGDAGTGVVGIGNTRFDSEEIRLRLVYLSNGVPIRRLETGRILAESFTDTVVVGPPATRSRAKEALESRPRWQAIHLAAPFLLDSDKPYASMLGLAPDGDDNGVLDLYQLIRLGLRAELTLLAACEPAKDTPEVGRALRAVSRGMQLSGSARVIASQWWTDDRAAATLMSNFYRFWENRKTPAPLALRRAQFKVTELHGWAHPKHWAGWQLWGAR